jgi:hypothetical protein
MVVTCLKHGHVLWTEVRTVGASRIWVYFDDQERSDTYAEQVARCPDCGTPLDDARELHGVAQRR